MSDAARTTHLLPTEPGARFRGALPGCAPIWWFATRGRNDDASPLVTVWIGEDGGEVHEDDVKDVGLTLVDATVTAAAQPTDVPAAPQAVRWVYWITYSWSSGAGSTECSFPARITHGTELLEIAQQLAQLGSVPKVSIDGFTLLRVEDSTGQVIG